MNDGGSERDEGTVLGDFVLCRQLGSDAWGDRWAVRRVPDDDDAAPDTTEYTMLVAREGDDEAREHLLEGLSEVKSVYAGTSLRHPGILGLEDAALVGDVPMLVFESFPGCGLDAMIDAWLERGEVDDDHDRRLAELFVEVGAAVQSGHELGIAHGDLRPSNLLVDGDRVRVQGYGLSIVTDDVRSLRSARLAITAPELVAEPDREVDELCDLYSLGVLMYWALTLAPPYQGHNREALRRAILRGDAPAPTHVQPWIPKALSRIVVQAMARRPEDRYASIEAFVADLYRYLDGEVVHARGPSTVDEALVWAKAHPRVCGGVAVALLAVALGGALSSGDDEQASAATAAPVDDEPVAVVTPAGVEALPPVEIDEDASPIASHLEVAPAPVPVVEELEPEPAPVEKPTPKPVVRGPVVPTRVVEPAPLVPDDDPEQATAAIEPDEPPAASTAGGPVVLEPQPVNVNPDVVEDAPWTAEIVEPDAEEAVADVDDEPAPLAPTPWSGAIDEVASAPPVDAVDAEPDDVAPLETTPVDAQELVAHADESADEIEDDTDTDDTMAAPAPVATVEPTPLEPEHATDDVVEPLAPSTAASDDELADATPPEPVAESVVEPEVVEAPPRPLTRGEWTARLRDASVALRTAHVDADPTATDVTVETVLSPRRSLPAAKIWSALDDATIAERMPELTASSRDAIGRLAGRLSMPARASRVAHPDWEAAFESMVVVGAVPPAVETVADLPPVDVVAPWLLARTSLAVLDGAYVPDMWIVPDLYLRAGRVVDAEILCEHLLSSGLPEGSAVAAHARLTWAAVRIAPGASEGGAAAAWAAIHDALDADDPALVARAAHVLGERRLRSGDVDAARELFATVAENAGSSPTLWSWSAEAERWVRSLSSPVSDAAALALDDPFDDPVERLQRALRWDALGCDEAARTVYRRVVDEGFASSEVCKLADRLRCASLLAARRPTDARAVVDELTDFGSAVLGPDVVYLMARTAVDLHRAGHDAYPLLTQIHDRVVSWYGDAADDARFVDALIVGEDPFAPEPPPAPLVEAAPAPPVGATSDAPTDAADDVVELFAGASEPVVAAKERASEPAAPPVDPATAPDADYVPPESDLRFPLRSRDG